MAKSLLLPAAAAALLVGLGACAGLPASSSTFDDVAWDLLEYISEDSTETVAVYYFLEGGERTAQSDYVMNSLSTALANAIHDEELSVRMVSRAALDRILEEQSFQVSGLVDPSGQLALGRQLGADIIVTGTITGFGASYEVNAQLIRTETGVILGGAVGSFSHDADRR